MSTTRSGFNSIYRPKGDADEKLGKPDVVGMAERGDAEQGSYKAQGAGDGAAMWVHRVRNGLFLELSLGAHLDGLGLGLDGAATSNAQRTQGLWHPALSLRKAISIVSQNSARVTFGIGWVALLH